MELVPYVVRQGDHLAKLALRLGFRAVDVWNHPKNQALSALRKTGSILAPGDILYVPEQKKTWLPVNVGTKNAFTTRTPPPTTDVHLVIVDDGKARGGLAYTVRYGDDTEITGTTGGDGSLKFTVPVSVVRAVLVLADRPEIPLLVGHLDPVDTLNGVMQRLASLKYFYGRFEGPEDELHPQLKGALFDFQMDIGITPATGILDDATRKALVSAFGC